MDFFTILFSARTYCILHVKFTHTFACQSVTQSSLPLLIRVITDIFGK